MSKKFRITTYEKDIGDHYVVVLNPWANGYKQRAQAQIDWMGAWLRIAFRNPNGKNIVKNIYTVETRSDIIARLDTSVDVEVGLGLHRWGEIMEDEHLERIKWQSDVDLSDKVSHIFLYNWKLHGDPAERQWQEWFPRQDNIPPNIMIKWEYPIPEWTEVPPVDSRLRTLLVPLPNSPELAYEPMWSAMHGAVAAACGGSILLCEEDIISPRREGGKARIKSGEKKTEAHQDSLRSPPQTATFSSYRPPLHLRAKASENTCVNGTNSASGSGKVDKLDPYEEDDSARAILGMKPVKQEHSNGIKAETETKDFKSDMQSTGYRPSNSLYNAVLKLRNDKDSRQPDDKKPAIKREDCLKVEEQDIKPDVRTGLEGHRPSNELVSAISRFTNSVDFSECEDRKPCVNEGGSCKVPCPSNSFFINVLDHTPRDGTFHSSSQFSRTPIADTIPNRIHKRDANDHPLSSEDMRHSSPEPRIMKKMKIETVHAD